jgi:hypothetical protein
MTPTIAPAPEPFFELAPAGHDGRAFNLLGLWRANSPDALPPCASPPMSVASWRVDLPANRARAWDRLRECRASLRDSERRLACVRARFAAVLDSASPDVAFVEPAVLRPSSVADQELVEWLRIAQGQRPAVAFGTGSAPSWWGAAWREVARFARVAGYCCAPTAQVESRLGAMLVGRSLVSLNGDVRTAWPAGVGPREALLHRDTVALASASRSALLRVLTLATQGAVAVSVRLALPGGAVLALPTAWKFIHRILQEASIGSVETRRART